MKLDGGNPQARAEGLDRLPGKAAHFIGRDPEKWCVDVSTFARVRYRQVYPGVDVVYHGNQGELEYDPGVRLIFRRGGSP